MVEFLRFGYQARFRLPTVSGDETFTYRFTLAADDASVISTGTLFNSLVWEDGSFRYGEIAGTRQWLPISAGGKPFIAAGEPHGTVDQFSGATSSPIIDKVALGGFLLPAACIGSQTMRAGFEVRDRYTAAFLASATWGVYNSTPSHFTAVMQSLLGSDTTVTYLDSPSSLFPKAAVIHSRFGWLVVIEGTTNEKQFLENVLGSLEHPSQAGEVSGAALPLLVALNYDAQLQRLGVYSQRQAVTFTGHSYGGSVAMLTAALAAQRSYEGRLSVATFGSPRQLAQSTINLLRRRAAIIAAYTVPNDPVPFLPPHSATLPYVVPLFGPFLADAWNQYVLWPSRTVVDIGEAFAEVYIDPNEDDLQTLLTTFVVSGSITYPIDQHGMDVYVGKLLAQDEPEPAPGWIDDYDSWDEWIDEILGPP